MSGPKHLRFLNAKKCIQVIKWEIINEGYFSPYERWDGCFFGRPCLDVLGAKCGYSNERDKPSGGFFWSGRWMRQLHRNCYRGLHTVVGNIFLTDSKLRQLSMRFIQAGACSTLPPSASIFAVKTLLLRFHPLFHCPLQ
jgi:hypothetical protein